MESFGNIIRKLREDKKLPLRTIAAYLDIDQAILSKIERGKRKASRTQVLKLSVYYGVKDEDLLLPWLSEKLYNEVADEEIALKVLKVAEEKIKYQIFKKTDREHIEKKIRNYLQTEGHIKKAWIFGSFSRGGTDYKSDIDLMIEVPDDSKFSLFDLSEIQYQLENLVNMKVDIVMKGGVKPHVMEKIKSDLRLIYER